LFLLEGKKMGHRLIKYPEWFKISLFLSLFLVFSISLYAEEIFTWEECVKIAKKDHPDLVSAEEKLNQVKADKAITTSNLLPQVDSSLSEKTSKSATKDKSDTYSYEVTGKQLLFDSLKTPYDIAQAKEKIKSSQFSYEVTSSNVRLRLRNAFVKLLRAQKLLSITEEITQRRKQNAELVKLRYKAGREHRGSLLTAEANLAQAEFEVFQAKRNIKLAQRRLNKELGRTKFVPLRVKGDFEIIYSDRERINFEDLAKGNPFLQELIAQKEAARFGLKSAKADFFPQVYATTGYGKSATDWPPDQEAWSVGASISLPIFEGGRRRAVVSQSRAKLSQTEADERSGRDSVILTLEETWTELQDAIDKVQVKKKFLKAAEERAKIAQTQYSSGLITFNDWIIIEDNLVSTKKAFLDAQADALIAEANWIQAKGGTLDD
jgi:outer membrane protein TolC